ncbi:MAG: F0F1 ATP synthase subunit B [Caldilineales bacterium]|nr:F0F1 ATP synthase subunit B [Caldilineales bacterium]MDW8316866.1 F0F1 ATP synthase subunit B [Anaerolineae bacterium]
MGEIFGQLGINAPFLLAQIVNFVVLLLILRLVLYKPMLKMLESRKQRIAEGLQAAEVARREAEAERARLQEQLDRERREAMERIAAASKRGETLAAEIEANARQEAARILAEARQEAESERERILAEAQEQIAELALLAAEKVLGRELANREAQRAFVQEFLASTATARN